MSEIIQTKKLRPTIQGKIVQLDYDFITSLEGECCYCLTDAQVQMILSITDYYGWGTRWFSTSGEIDKQVIIDLKTGLEETLMSGCCGSDTVIIYRYNGTVLEQSDDGGVTWTPAPLADYRNISIIWPDPEDLGIDSTKCQAADGVVATFRDQINEQITEDMGAAAILAVVAAALLFFVTAGTSIEITPLIIGLVGSILAAGVTAWQAAFTTDVWDQFRCLVYSNMDSDSSINQAGVDALYASLDTAFTGIVIPTLKGYINASGVVGLTNMMRSNSGDPDANCEDCICPNQCDTVWTFYGVHDVVFDGCNTYTMLADGGGVHVAFSSGNSADGCYCTDGGFNLGSWWPVGSGSPVGGTNPKTTAIWNYDAGDPPADTAYTFIFSSAPIT